MQTSNLPRVTDATNQLKDILKIKSIEVRVTVSFQTINWAEIDKFRFPQLVAVFPQLVCLTAFRN